MRMADINMYNVVYCTIYVYIYICVSTEISVNVTSAYLIINRLLRKNSLQTKKQLKIIAAVQERKHT